LLVAQKFRQKVEMLHKPLKMCKILNFCRKMLVHIAQVCTSSDKKVVILLMDGDENSTFVIRLITINFSEVTGLLQTCLMIDIK